MKLFDEDLLSKLQKIATPYYYYDLRILDATLTAIRLAIKDLPYYIHYAMKANSNSPVLQKVKESGFGVDTVSGKEIEWAIKHGFKGNQIAFAGVGKTDDEILIGLQHDVFTFNVESLAELNVINELAKSENKKAKIAIRLNPNVDANTHHYITTGLDENKFGINLWELSTLFQLLPKLKNLELKGLHFHVGSQIRDLSVFKILCNRVNELQGEFRERNLVLEHINVGGGLGINYENPDHEIIPDFKTYFNVYEKFLELLPQQKLHFELGRSIIGQSAALISRVLYVKEGIKTNFVILDAGMTELIRPALYQSSHYIQNLSKNGMPLSEKYDVVGPICESSDCFGKGVLLPVSKRGDIFAIRSVGAYGQVMSSQYNLREIAKTIYHAEL
ncbi:MAG TPA: diaminopimelate decarboxylase [Flavobacteriaceae bacterium]|nr:diaminopimelate decarboxylase [Flavobacteriaceae bacterium]